MGRVEVVGRNVARTLEVLELGGLPPESNVTKRLTITSPTSAPAPIPPPVPVVITSFGLQSSMICFQTSRFGVVASSSGPSWEKWDSDLNRVTLLPAISALQ